MEMGKKMKKIIEGEVHTSQDEDTGIAAGDKWQKEFEAEERYKEELRMEGAKLEREKISNSIDGFVNPILKKILSNSISKKPKKRENLKTEVLTVTGIDIPKIVTDLEERHFLDAKYKAIIVEWFSGLQPSKPIPIDTSAAVFVSIIADLMDTRPKCIKNSKEFVYKYIATSFLFNGKKCEVSTIKQLMKPGNNKGRVSYHTRTIPNILDFKSKYTT